MRRSVLSWIAACLLWGCSGSAAFAQEAKTEGPSQAIPYTIAAIGTIIVMILICMPARRE